MTNRIPPNKNKGDGIEFLRRHVMHDGDDCVMWPLYREPRRGYGIIGYLGRTHKAHRLMCELAHGAPPFPGAEASHSCGNGHLGCVNPKHLSWKTRSENQQDRKKHGTAGRGDIRRYKLTLQDVSEIRALLPTTTTQDIAERFGVTRSNIRQIQLGKTWGEDKPAPRFFSDEEVRLIRSTTGRTDLEVANEYGVGRAVIWRIRNCVTYRDVA